MNKNNQVNLNKSKKVVYTLIRKAGKKLKKGFFEKEKQISFKDEFNNDYVTKYDIILENLIVANLEKYFPDFNILTEEKKSINKNSHYTWIIDPIDGTRNFAKGIAMFMIGIALSYKNDVIQCFAYNPIIDELFFAQKGQGAFMNDKRIKVSNSKFNQYDVDIEVAMDKNSKANIFSKFLTHNGSVKKFGTNIFSTTILARGGIDVLICRNLKPWDYAQYLIVQEAGGVVTDFNGEEFNIKKKHAIMSNGKFHNKLLNLINSEDEI